MSKHKPLLKFKINKTFHLKKYELHFTIFKKYYQLNNKQFNCTDILKNHLVFNVFFFHHKYMKFKTFEICSALINFGSGTARARAADGL